MKRAALFLVAAALTTTLAACSSGDDTSGDSTAYVVDRPPRPRSRREGREHRRQPPSRTSGWPAAATTPAARPCSRSGSPPSAPAMDAQDAGTPLDEDTDRRRGWPIDSSLVLALKVPARPAGRGVHRHPGRIEGALAGRQSVRERRHARPAGAGRGDRHGSAPRAASRSCRRPPGGSRRQVVTPAPAGRIRRMTETLLLRALSRRRARPRVPPAARLAGSGSSSSSASTRPCGRPACWRRSSAARRARPAARPGPATFLVAVVGGRIVGRLSLRHRLQREPRPRSAVTSATPSGRRSPPRGRQRDAPGRAGRGRPGRRRTLVTCDDDDVGSATVIERCGGGRPARSTSTDRASAATTSDLRRPTSARPSAGTRKVKPTERDESGSLRRGLLRAADGRRGPSSRRRTRSSSTTGRSGCVSRRSTPTGSRGSRTP